MDLHRRPGRTARSGAQGLRVSVEVGAPQAAFQVQAVGRIRMNAPVQAKRGFGADRWTVEAARKAGERRWSSPCTVWRRASPGFFHQAALTALLRGLLRDAPDYDLHLRIDTPESGRVDYRPGDYYRFLLIALRGGAPPPLACPHGHLFWVDNEYRDAEGADQVMGGLSGLLHLEGRLSPAWWRLLILGQYVGMGQRTAFGFGRYQLRTADGGFSYRRPLPAASLLTRALQALSPAVESLFSAGVHGDRPGRSRITASHAI